MFTGIVEAVGRIERIEMQGDGLRLTVAPGRFDLTGVKVGDSIAVNGSCLTVVGLDSRTLAFDVSAETLRCTTALDAPGDVNLEKSLRLADRLGGHLIAGHIDGIGSVVAFAAVAGDAWGSWQLVIDAPDALARFIASKGSIAVQGVSLTVNTVSGARFAVNVIPHTLAVTTLKNLFPGAQVNLEVDLVARYVARLVEFERD